MEAGKLKVVFKHGLIRVEYREVELLARIGKQRNAAFRAGFQQRVLAQQARSPKPQMQQSPHWAGFVDASFGGPG
ncbi:hypothetical protein [Pseudomonas fluorescens]|uniref:hypothetical protein n=1 Tax=Pseudomonas fluorescens TaxID=294 RepID=UPI003D20AA13